MLIRLWTSTQPFLSALTDFLGYMTWSTLKLYIAQSVTDYMRAIFFYTSQHCGWLFSLYLYPLPAAATTLSDRPRAFLQSLTTSRNMMGDKWPAFTFSGFCLCLIRGNTKPFQLQLSIYSFTRKLKTPLRYPMLSNKPPTFPIWNEICSPLTYGIIHHSCQN